MRLRRTKELMDEEYHRLSKADYTPKAVVESRWKTKRFNAEVAYRGNHYIVARELPTREDAQAAAQAIVDKITEGFDRHANQHLHNFPIAKE